MTLILLAGIMGVLLVFVALVIDLGKARSTDQVNDAVVDDAAIAGAYQLGDDGEADQSCTTAWNYIKANIGRTSFALSPTCNQLSTKCVNGSRAGSPRPSVQVDDQVYTFINPVADDDPLLDSRLSDSDLDPCRRFAVAVTDASDNVFAEGAIDLRSSAVAVRGVATETSGGGGGGGGGGGTAAVVLLDPTGCDVLHVEGSSWVRLLSGTAPGSIYVDSTGAACGKNDGVVNLSGGGQVGVFFDDAAGSIQMRNPSSVHITGSAQTPRVTEQVGNQLRASAEAAYGPSIASLQSLATGTGTPAGYQKWTTWMRANRPDVGDPCSVDGGTSWNGVPSRGSPYPIVVPAGNWHIDCPSGLQLRGNGSIRFMGGNFVMDRSMHLGSIPMALNCPDNITIQAWTQQSNEIANVCNPTADVQMVVRQGDVFTGDGTSPLVLERVFAYAPNGTFDVGNSKSWYWTAPESSGNPFAGLLLWSPTSSAPIELSGSWLHVTLSGVVYAPNAPVEITGSRQLLGQGLQLLVHRLRLTGNTNFSTRSTSQHVTETPPAVTTTEPGGVTLIR